jgi:activator of HSP90 ATPase
MQIESIEKRIAHNLIEQVPEDAMKINVISRFLEWSCYKNKNIVSEWNLKKSCASCVGNLLLLLVSYKIRRMRKFTVMK